MKFAKNIFKACLITTGSFLLIFAVLYLLLRVPSIQRYTLNQITDAVSARLGIKVELASVGISFPSGLSLSQAAVYDEYLQPIVCADQLDISLFSISLWEMLFQSGKPRHVFFRSIDIEGLDLHIVRYGDSTLNIDALLSDTSSNDDTARIEWDLRKLTIRRSKFSYQDYTDEAVNEVYPERLNFANISLVDLNLDTRLRFSPGKQISLLLNELVFKEDHSGFKLDNLITSCQVSLDKWRPLVALDEITLDMEDTHIRGDLAFPFSTLDQVLDEGLNRAFNMHLSGSRIDFSSFRFFVTEKLPLAGVIIAQGDISGTLNDLSTSQFSARYGDSTLVRADVRVQHLGDDRPLFLDIVVARSKVLPADVLALLPQVRFPGYFRTMRAVDLDGFMKGSQDKLNFQARIGTSNGSIDTDLRLNIPSGRAPLSYEGRLVSRNLNLDALGIDIFMHSRLMNFDGEIMGSGVELENLDVKMRMSIHHSDLWGRPVDSLSGSLLISDKQMEGQLVLNDKEGKGKFDLSIDLRETPAAYSIDGYVQSLNLKKYLEWKDPFLLSGRMEMYVNGDSLDNINGDVDFYNMRLVDVNKGVSIDVPELNLFADNNTVSNKYYSVRSSLIDADLYGNFTISKGYTYFDQFVREIGLFVQNDSSRANAYYAGKKIDALSTEMSVRIITGDSVNRLLDFLHIPAYISSRAKVDCNVKFGLTDVIELTTSIDSLAYDNVQMKKADFFLNSYKRASSPDSLLSFANLTVASLVVGKQYPFKNINFYIDGLDRHIETDFHALQGDDNNKLQMKFGTDFLDNGKIVASFDANVTYFILKNDTVRVDEYNTITLNNLKNTIRVDDFILKGKRGILEVNGEINPEKDSVLRISLQQFRMSHLESFYPMRYELDGEGNFEVNISDVYGLPKVSGKGTIKGFTLDDFSYGDLVCKTSWNKESDRVLTQAAAHNKRDTTISLRGYYDLVETSRPLYLFLSTPGNLPLNYISPFVKGDLYGISGTVKLEAFTLTGSLEDISVKGVGKFNNASFGIEYFKTEYRFTGDIEFDNNRIKFPDLTVRDRNNKPAKFHGDIYHKGLRQFEFDLQMDDMREFLIMDTRKTDNELFYGKVLAKNGVAAITGNLDKLDIQAYLMVGEQTHLYIPIDYGASLDKPDYIIFNGEKDRTGANVNAGTQGFQLNLNLLVTSAAEVELIFDEKVGDIIRGKGEGNLTMKINEQGDLGLYGRYEVIEGDYLFTARNIINKRFKIKQGSTITWSGDPYDASLNIDAIYSLNADIKDLVRSERSLRVPTQVVMRMEGSLLQPTIALDIDLPNLQAQEAAQIVSYLRSMRYDEQELSKQVFSLMVFSRFAPLGGFSNENLANTGVTTSISELISNQLNFWLSQALNDRVSINVSTNNLQDVSLLVSAKLFNERVVIERDGVIMSTSGNRSGLGNVRIIIRLNQDANKQNSLQYKAGELVLEVFSRAGLDQRQQNTVQTGMGIFFKKDFDRLLKLFGAKA